MRIHYSFAKIRNLETPTFVLGAFESVHKGHAKLIEMAESLKQPFMVVLFRDPLKLPKSNGEVFNQLELRLTALFELGVKDVFVIDFDEWFKNLSAEQFVDILQQQGAKTIVVGNDYRFGHGATKTPTDLSKIFPNVIAVDLYTVGNQKVSTTMLKAELANGNLELVNDYSVTKYAVDIYFNGKVSPKTWLWPENIARIHPGVYITTFLFQELEWHGFVRVDLNHQIHWQIFDNNFSGTIQEIFVRIEFWKTLRLITSSIQDLTNDTDIKQVRNFWVEFQKTESN
ncbi:FAD synthase [Candidatus Mycoplasma pogonae]